MCRKNFFLIILSILSIELIKKHPWTSIYRA